MRASTAAAYSLIGASGLLVALSLTGREAGAGAEDQFAELPDTLVLTGVVRDFRERTESGGHTDFEKKPDNGFGHYMNNVSAILDQDDKPVFVGGGNRVGSQWTDSSGNPIYPGLFNPDLGDVAGAYNMSGVPGGIASAESFAQWYRDVPGVNMSKPLPITLVRQDGTNLYVFDDKIDPNYSSLGGFFPINNQLFGNSNGESKNFHFTYELATEFIYQPGQGHIFKFKGDDDVWVFINGQMVIDIGGVHSAVTQTVELDRLSDILRPNDANTLHFFFAERHRTQSNFRIETTLNLRTAELPSTSHVYD